MGCSVGLIYAKNALAAGAPFRTPLGSSRHSSRPASRLERGTPCLSPFPPPRRPRRLDSRAFSASILVPPLLYSWLRSCVWFKNLDRSFYHFVTNHRQTEFSLPDRVCIPCSAEKLLLRRRTLARDCSRQHPNKSSLFYRLL